MNIGVEQSSLEPEPKCVGLYVEDDDATAYLFQKALVEAGASLRLFRVTDGEQGLAFLLRKGVYQDAPVLDLVIIDLSLPKRSGFELLAAIRQTEALKKTPIVVFSSSTLPDWKERALALGADLFCMKCNDWSGFVETAKAIHSLLPGYATG